MSAHYRGYRGKRVMPYNIWFLYASLALFVTASAIYFSRMHVFFRSFCPGSELSASYFTCWGSSRHIRLSARQHLFPLPADSGFCAVAFVLHRVEVIIAVNSEPLRTPTMPITSSFSVQAFRQHTFPTLNRALTGPWSMRGLIPIRSSSSPAVRVRARTYPNRKRCVNTWSTGYRTGTHIEENISTSTTENLRFSFLIIDSLPQKRRKPENRRAVQRIPPVPRRLHRGKGR